MVKENKYTYQGWSSAEVARFLREVADGLENPKEEKAGDVLIDVSDLRKLKISIKKDGDAYAVKIKSRSGVGDRCESAEAAEENTSLPDYKPLKKRMKREWKAILGAVKAGKLPDKGVLTSFLADSEIMTRFPGVKMGEDYYDAYRTACRQLQTAFDAADIPLFREAVAETDRLKAGCHERYK